MDPVTFKLNNKDVQRVISANTIMLYGSAPSFPQGTVDDITGLSEMAVKYGIGLHVDMCLGGFILPFARRMGYDIPAFDFDLPGVTSMSVDTHKFGYALKGSSVVLYRYGQTLGDMDCTQFKLFIMHYYSLCVLMIAAII